MAAKEKKEKNQPEIPELVKDSVLGKKAKELLDTYEEFADVQDRMGKERLDVLKLMKKEKKDKIRIGNKVITVTHGEDKVKVSTKKED